MNCHDASVLIDGYIDRELTPDDRALVRAHLDACPACARAAGERIELGRMLAAVPYHTAPPRLRRAVLEAARRPRIPVAALATAAAIVLAASLATAVGTRSFRRERATEAVAERLVGDHVRALREDHVTDVRSDDRHTVKPWFLGKLDFAPPVNDLSSAGFSLIGGRLGRIDGRNVAVLVYRRRLHPIAVFVWPAADTATKDADARTVRGFHVRHWTAGGMAFWAVSDMNDDELTTLVQALQ